MIISFHSVVTCPPLQAPSDGSVKYSDRDLGSVAEYSCDKGFSLKGDHARVCQSDGNWSGEKPVCQESGMYIHVSRDKISNIIH